MTASAAPLSVSEKTLPPPQPVTIFLESGAAFDAQGWGDFAALPGGEFVFCTAMSGVEESLTDPSFAGQVIVSTVSHVGNTGFTGEDMESSRIWAEGLVTRHMCVQPSNWRARASIPQWMLQEKRFVLEGVDTRALTTHLREHGSQRGVVAPAGKLSVDQALKEIRTRVPDMNGRDLTDLVSCAKAYDFAAHPAYWPMGSEYAPKQLGLPLEVAVWDFGIKNNTLRFLTACGARVRVLPARAKADELLAAGRDGILLGNGPGDPAAATHIVQEIKQILGKREIFAICLGHQLMGLALGAKTYKMKFGHRGIHHPVVEIDEKGQVGRTWITSQNHGFAIDRETLPKNARVSFTHADDDSVEGLSCPTLRCETVQFHPEVAPGPMDSGALLKQFMARVSERATR